MPLTQQMNVLRVFLASPSDLVAERKATKEMVNGSIAQSVRPVGPLISLVGRIASLDSADHKPKLTKTSMLAISSWAFFGAAGDLQAANSSPDSKKSSSEHSIGGDSRSLQKYVSTSNESTTLRTPASNC